MRPLCSMFLTVMLLGLPTAGVDASAQASEGVGWQHYSPTSRVERLLSLGATRYFWRHPLHAD